MSARNTAPRLSQRPNCLPEEFRENQFFGGAMNPRHFKPNQYRDMLVKFCRPTVFHPPECTIHSLINLGTVPETPTGVTMSMAHRHSSPGYEHPLDLTCDAYALLCRKYYTLNDYYGDYEQLTDHFGEFQTKLDKLAKNFEKYLDTTRDNKQIQDTKMIGLLFWVLARQVCKDAKETGLCSCEGFVEPRKDILGEQHYELLDMSRTQKINMKNLGQSRDETRAGLISMKSRTGEPTAPHFNMWIKQRASAVNIWRNKVMVEKAVPVRPYHREAIIAYYSKNPIKPAFRPRRGQDIVMEIYPTYGKPSSTKSVAELEVIDFRGLKYPKIHYNQLIHCRVISDTVVSGLGIKFAVEDIHGHALPLHVECPLPKPAPFYPHDFLQKLYPKGAILNIKEPYVRFSPTAGGAEICVSIPSDIVEIWDNGEIEWKYPAPPGSISYTEDYKILGNDALVEAKNPMLAHIYYTRGLLNPKVDVQTKVAFLLNRMQASLSTDRPGSAYRDSLTIDSLLETKKDTLTEAQQTRFKARKTKALEGIDLNTPKTITKNSHGETWNKLDKDWIGPIQVREIPGKGYGLVATRDISPGEVLMVETPYSQVYPDAEIPISFIYFGEGKYESVRTTNGWLATCQMIHRLMDDPRLWNRFGLVHPRISKTNIGENCIVEKELWEQASIEINNVALKFHDNASGATIRNWTGPKVDFLGREMVGMALWVQYSGINHSCLTNVSCMSGPNGDLKKTTALREIKEGQELFTSYIPENFTFKKRREGLESSWGFTCSCELCKLDEADGRGTIKREEMMQKEWPVIKLKDSKAMLDFKQRLETTFAPGRVIRPQIAIVLFEILGRPAKSYEDVYTMGKECLVAAGCTLTTAAEAKSIDRAVKEFQLEILDIHRIAEVIGKVHAAASHLSPRKVRPDQVKAWQATANFLLHSLLASFDGLPDMEEALKAFKSTNPDNKSNKTKLVDRPDLSGDPRCAPGPLNKEELYEIMPKIMEATRKNKDYNPSWENMPPAKMVELIQSNAELAGEVTKVLMESGYV